MIEDRDIPAEALSVLQTLYNTRELNPKVIVAYWDVKRVLDKIDASPWGRSEYALVCFRSGISVPAVAPKPLNIAEQLRKKKFQEGHPITVMWQNKPQSAKFLCVTSAGEVEAQLPGDPHRRTFASDSVLAIGEGTPT